MAEQNVHRELGYNFGHKMRDVVDPDQLAGTSLPYKAVSRIINVIEDLHAQCQKGPQERPFVDYPIVDFEEIDTFIRDHMVNLAISLETRAIAEKSGEL